MYTPYATKILSHVQKGVYYAPDIHFAAFDILVSFAAENVPPYALSWDSVLEAVAGTGMQTAPMLLSGTLAECLQFAIQKVDSVVPKMLGYPVLHPNQIEGLG